MKNAEAQLKKNFESNSQERIKFDMSVLRNIKGDLENIFHKKCAYCETKLGVSADAHIDNFRPKGGSRDLDKSYAISHYWWLAYTWDNLFLCCPVCNKYKTDLFPIEPGSSRAAIGAVGDELKEEKALLIDPCADEPRDHLSFEKDGKVVGLTKKGTVTIQVLGLNRAELVSSRREIATNLEYRLQNINKGKSTEKNQAFKKEIMEILSDGSSLQYLALQRSIFEAWYLQNKSFWDKLNPSVFMENVMSSLKNTIPLAEKYLMQLKSESLRVENQVKRIKRFTIKSIEIKNFRTIDYINLEILPSDSLSERESWLLLLGDNGVGKSSILQAIALTLSGSTQFEKLNVKAKDYLKNDKQEGFVKIHSYENNEPLTLHFNRKEFKSDLKQPPTFILGYGSTRLLPRGDLRPQARRSADVNIANLFDYSVALTDVNRWLKTVSTEEFETRIAPALFDLLDMDKTERVTLMDGKLSLGKFTGQFGIDKISDGYKAMIALACDIMKTLSVDGAGYHNVQGIVLIDELGNHLHPRWRMKIVEALRKAFPRLQFIVSTHEPLCLRGLLHGEVVVLLEDELKRVRTLDKTLLPDHNLLRIDQLLTSDLFGLMNTLDANTEKKYEEYYKLLSKHEKDRNSAESKQIEAYTSEFAEKEIIGVTPQLQLFYKIINEKYAQNLIKDGFKTKTEVKDETLEQLRDMFNNENMDWL